MTETPASLLERAAKAIEECASKATSGPWIAAGGFGSWRIKVEDPAPDEDDVAYDIMRVDDADWIAALSPTVSAPLVAWLREAASAFESYGGMPPGLMQSDEVAGTYGHTYRFMNGALELAKLLLGLPKEEETT